MLSGLQRLTCLKVKSSHNGKQFEPDSLAGKNGLQHLEVVACCIPGGSAGIAALLAQLQHSGLAQLQHSGAVVVLEVPAALRQWLAKPSCSGLFSLDSQQQAAAPRDQRVASACRREAVATSSCRT
jgi:hypothetical protein